MIEPYNPLNVITTWGPLSLAGFAGDDIIAIEFDEDAITKTVGGQGEWVWVVNANRGGKAKFSILQNAPINAQLSALAVSTRPKRAPLVIMPFMMTDLGGTTLALGPQAVIQKVPPITRKKGHSALEWVLDIGEWTTLVNGGQTP
jgi:hypothetical protein